MIKTPETITVTEASATPPIHLTEDQTTRIEEWLKARFGGSLEQRPAGFVKGGSEAKNYINALADLKQGDPKGALQLLTQEITAKQAIIDKQKGVMATREGQVEGDDVYQELQLKISGQDKLLKADTLQTAPNLKLTDEERVSLMNSLRQWKEQFAQTPRRMAETLFESTIIDKNNLAALLPQPSTPTTPTPAPLA